MNIDEFDYLVINTPNDWQQGQAQSLVINDTGQLALASKELVSLMQPGKDTAKPLDPLLIAFDRKNSLYLLEHKCRLFKYAKQLPGFQPVGYKDNANQSDDIQPFLASEISNCSRIAFGISVLYVLDKEKGYLYGFDFPSFQLRFSIGDSDQASSFCKEEKLSLDNPIDILADKQGNVWVLDTGNRQILMINQNGDLRQTIGFDQGECCRLKAPIAMTFAPIEKDCASLFTDDLYVLDAGNLILKFDQVQNGWVSVINFWAIDPCMQSRSIAVDKNGIITIGGSSQTLLQFTQSGKYIGDIAIEGECFQLLTDQKRQLYCLCGAKKQIIGFVGNAQFATQGTYISKNLDSKTYQCQWHRLFLNITLPEKTQLQVHYFASDTKIKPEEIEAEQKWQTFLNNSNNDIQDALFENAIGQYLILKFEFTGDGHESPRVQMAQVYFQRNSYLRFLPAVYQEDSRGRDFLERFLSLYESMFLGVEEKINHITQYFDADVPEIEFLDWLSSWLAVMVDENWPEPKRRLLLKEAFQLYKTRGTQKTLRRVIEIFTGGQAAIIEHWRLRPPMILSQALRVGVNSHVGPKRTQLLILEESSIIGEFILEEQEDAPEKPFLLDAYDFTVLVDTSNLKGEYEKILRRLIEDEKPAHTQYFLRTTQGAVAQLGQQSLLGVNTVLGDGMKPMRIGENASIGETTLIGTQYSIKGTLGMRSRVAVDAVLH
jgi:phage tail-like protein